MTRFFSFLSLALVSAVAAATPVAQSDSINHAAVDSLVLDRDLPEITIEGKNQYFTAKGAVYVPSRIQKQASADAVDLLARMAIPQIRATPGGSSVTDVFGNQVKIFINYQEAGEPDIKGLRTTDVINVQYLVDPTDPRFLGNRKVVNFLVRVYEFGGYTKLSLSESVLAGLSSMATVYSRLNYKSVNFDVYAGAMNWDTDHTGRSEHSVFRGVTGSPVRDQINAGGHLTQSNYPVTFRASYSSNKFTVDNKIGFVHYGQPVNKSTGTVSLTGDEDGGYDYRWSNPSRENTVEYKGQWGVFMPGNMALYLCPTFSYSHVNDTYEYLTPDAPDITRHSRDNKVSGGGMVFWSKNFGRHYISSQVSVNGQHNSIDYTGSADYHDSFDWMNVYGDIFYKLVLNRLSISPRLGFNWEKSTINSQSTCQANPSAQLHIGYTPNDRHAFELFTTYGRKSPSASSKSPDTFRQNELLYYSGNPRLKPVNGMTAMLSYSFMARSNLNFNLYGFYIRDFDKITTLYQPWNDATALRRVSLNDGDFSRGTVGLSASLSLFRRTLILNAHPKMSFYRLTGSTGNQSLDCFEATVSASYYLKRFYFSLYYIARPKSIDPRTNTLTTGRDNYFAQIGWSNGQWNLRLTAYQPFKKGWDAMTETIDTPQYYSRSVSYAQSGHARVSLSASFTFGYGRSVNRGNEVGAIERSESAILK